ncbi:hypothetical protein [Aquisphaera insulae]|uniref:hypothetical protein n=1 Tax=Aquisphaera insulae TaxID=2712864 RepID=UPI0013EA6593|nr:hypothetical protein [Aquisphaera insulae]
MNTPDINEKRPMKLAAAGGAAAALSLLAAALAWAAGESGRLDFAPATAKVNVMGTVGDSTTSETRAAAQVRSTAVVYAIFGGLLGLGIGAAVALVGLVGRGGRAGYLPMLAGLVAGVVAGAAGPIVVLPLYSRLVLDRAGEFLPSMATHAALWLGFGVTAGLAWGLGVGDRRGLVRSVLMSVLCVALGAVIYEVLSAIAMPTSVTTDPVPAEAPARLMALACAALSACLGAVFSGAGRAAT